MEGNVCTMYFIYVCTVIIIHFCADFIDYHIITITGGRLHLQSYGQQRAHLSVEFIKNISLSRQLATYMIDVAITGV